ncbi:MAG: hypothetical protein NC489_27495 [Ruminococcus flavefaciens]|nr:hypothetical protein [Ruminococcus flavefaciens]
MFKNLRIICCIISALIVAADIFVFIYAGMIWGLIGIFAAALFFFAMLYFKYRQEEQKKKDNPPPAKGDFITGKVENREDNGDGQ